MDINSYIYNLIESDWGFDEILREVEIRLGQTTEQALKSLVEIANDIGDGAEDAPFEQREALRMGTWAEIKQSRPGFSQHDTLWGVY
jgi:hypothetical protein